MACMRLFDSRGSMSLGCDIGDSAGIYKVGVFSGRLLSSLKENRDKASRLNRKIGEGNILSLKN